MHDFEYTRESTLSSIQNYWSCSLLVNLQEIQDLFKSYKDIMRFEEQLTKYDVTL